MLALYVDTALRREATKSLARRLRSFFFAVLGGIRLWGLFEERRDTLLMSVPSTLSSLELRSSRESSRARISIICLAAGMIGDDEGVRT